MADPCTRTPEIALIDLVSSDSGVHAIDSPVKIKILSLLQDRDLSFDDIVSRCQKAKSTVSVHLKDLYEAGIVGSRPDPVDRRKKVFYLDSFLLGGTARPEREKCPVGIPESIVFPRGASSSVFFRFTLRTIRVSLIREGVSIDPLLHRAGLQVGQAVYQEVADPEFGVFLSNLQAFWKTRDLGRIEVESSDPVVLRIYDCFECVDLPRIGKPACALDAGILTGLFSAWYGNDQAATETSCYAMGNRYCEFVVEEKPPRLV
jgi:predicted hydrocarbon binding protein